eukprot:TRINITY_DN41263_c0_g1_i1.p1 TRINITY_DN41263_c0_g1~~TRINITY_DN41263_c0_g1_i1.p1  ORF type:complete len:380 (+),score=88.38 TRINITY_DN41263_c0_g1_i1:80-1219(+)
MSLGERLILMLAPFGERIGLMWSASVGMYLEKQREARVFALAASDWAAITSWRLMGLFDLEELSFRYEGLCHEFDKAYFWLQKIWPGAEIFASFVIGIVVGGGIAMRLTTRLRARKAAGEKRRRLQSDVRCAQRLAARSRLRRARQMRGGSGAMKRQSSEGSVVPVGGASSTAAAGLLQSLQEMEQHGSEEATAMHGTLERLEAKIDELAKRHERGEASLCQPAAGVKAPRAFEPEPAPSPLGSCEHLMGPVQPGQRRGEVSVSRQLGKVRELIERLGIDGSHGGMQLQCSDVTNDCSERKAATACAQVSVYALRKLQARLEDQLCMGVLAPPEPYGSLPLDWPLSREERKRFVLSMDARMLRLELVELLEGAQPPGQL